MKVYVVGRIISGRRLHRQPNASKRGDLGLTNIVLAGVGGQGIITLAALIGDAAMSSGYDVRISEVHGMAQRGGRVVCHVKYGPKVHSPLVPEETADIVASTEASEVLEILRYLKPDGTVLFSDYRLIPSLAIIKGLGYPDLETIIESARNVAERVYIVRAQEIARRLGSLNVVNTVMLGALWATGELKISRDKVEGAVTVRFGEKWRDLNMKALEEGIKSLPEGLAVKPQ
ncbi:MAG: indolepyruvate oxidoreductase subunit beta [Candidatus Nezhaarchaeota archaeon]|nr:indolepyruvate oxidoreductase subunit beta [Candidatus Nezhaarchaeota archaeon]